MVARASKEGSGNRIRQIDGERNPQFRLEEVSEYSNTSEQVEESINPNGKR